jgi:transcription-repair coupling factor (superfamily II helicase)
MDRRHDWLRRWLEAPPLAAVIEACGSAHALPGAGAGVGVVGSRGSSATLLAGAVAVGTRRPVLYVTAHLDEADDAYDDLELFEHAGHALRRRRFGALEVLPGESSVSLDLLAERLSVVQSLSSPRAAGESDRGDIIIAPVQALMQAVPSADAMPDLTLTLAEGKPLPPGQLFDWLTLAGYNRVDAIEQPGDYATRGGIIDIYPPAAAGSTGGEPAGPIRLDYFGDDIESIRRLDPDTLRSGQRIASTQILGARSVQLQNDDRTTNVIDLLPSDTIVVMHEVMELHEQARGYYERLTDPRGIYMPRTVFAKLASLAHVEVNQYSETTSAGDVARFIALPVEPLPSLAQDAGDAVKELGELAVGYDVTVLCQNDAERDRLAELVREHACAAVDRIVLEVGYLHRGFVLASGPTPLLLLPHHELFHRYDLPGSRRRLRKVTAGAGTAVSDAFLDLEVGDYVVHVDHGIARFAGLKTMKKGGDGAPAGHEEYLTLEFAGRAVMHVPATQIDLIQKYVGGFEGRPPLSTLGGKRWQKQKEQVSDAVKDLAGEMLRLHAARASQPGIRFPDDTTWQKEFEAEFPYPETEDQLAAIAAIKRDMMHERPMDRLICGDVGFGKTEVAIRAAFKAAEYGRQVAVLVPTTVLAEQHERTFRGRMADYPFRVASLSRFKTAAEQDAIVADLAAGRVDVVIGTHRLLSGDVRFADLGLVIIDEEQRFGVEHKNRLLQFRLTADVLTLTATPIPRTLHMAMVGLRDISSLTTAPVDRRAIVTETIRYEPQRVRQAIVRELSRDGQVYFVHNRVHDIQSVADDIQQLVPDARIVVGHGQMPIRELEQVMLRFIRRDADILVCTTIIESGIDIPTANTIFIHNADHFGLADLHQLRGRVGRYKHRAYCYLVLPDDRPIGEVAAKRLKAVEQFSMLGAGFKIAMRDMEIRGAGNLLGSEQSGHIAAVGYEMYCHLLEIETKKLRHEPVIEPARTHLELPVTGHLPKRYVPSDKFRMEAYRRISRAATLDELSAVRADLLDAYGQPPPQAQSLLDLTEVRVAASTRQIDRIKLDGPDLIFIVRRAALLDDVFRRAGGRVSVIDEKTIYWRPPPSYLHPPTLLAVLRKMLTADATVPDRKVLTVRR